MARGGAGATRRGRLAEAIAARWLELQGMELVDGNRRAGGGEVDLVARDGVVLVFVEVRLRARGARVGAALSIGPAKRQRLRRCARVLLRAGGLPRWPGQRYRFDAVLMEESPQGLALRHLRQIL